MIFDQFLDPSYTLPRKDQPEQIVWNGVNYYVLTIFFDTIALCVRREDADGGAAYINTCIVPYIKGLTSFLEQQQPPAAAPADAPADATVAEAPVEAPADAPADATVAEAPAEPVAETPAETPAEAPAEAPVEAPVEAPAEAPADAPAADSPPA